jgi:hypothetical protein
MFDLGYKSMVVLSKSEYSIGVSNAIRKIVLIIIVTSFHALTFKVEKNVSTF